jgi:hypothetical protein
MKAGPSDASNTIPNRSNRGKAPTRLVDQQLSLASAMCQAAKTREDITSHVLGEKTCCNMSAVVTRDENRARWSECRATYCKKPIDGYTFKHYAFLQQSRVLALLWSELRHVSAAGSVSYGVHPSLVSLR